MRCSKQSKSRDKELWWGLFIVELGKGVWAM